MEVEVNTLGKLKIPALMLLDHGLPCFIRGYALMMLLSCAQLLERFLLITFF